MTEVFAARGVPVADADRISREILQPGSPVLADLAGRFGPDILREDGTLDRRGLADAITHPAIVRRIEAAREAARRAGSPLFVIDGAVLVGSVIDGIWDTLVVVAAPYEVSVARIVARDGIRPEMARRRLDAQLPEEALAARADILLENDGAIEQLRQKAEALADSLLAEAERGPGATVCNCIRNFAPCCWRRCWPPVCPPRCAGSGGSSTPAGTTA